MFANYIPKGASKGAATPIGALLRKDIISICVAEVVLWSKVLLLLSRSDGCVPKRQIVVSMVRYCSLEKV
jgi:hypothetical protein